MANRLHLPSAGAWPSSGLRAATFVGISPRELRGKTCMTGVAGVPGFTMCQFDDCKKLPVAWTHGWHMRQTTDLEFKD